MREFPIDTVRDRFPALSLTDEGRPRVYLDNPAGTQVPRTVVDAVSRCLVETNANLGGAFTTSIEAEKVVDDAHAAMADFLGTDDPGEITIGPAMTPLTLHLSRSICRDFQPGDEIIVTRMDHEGDVAPWLEIAEDKELSIKYLPFDRESWRIEPDALAAMLTERTKLVALNHASNLTGAINDIKSLVAIAKKSDVLTFVDSVQFAPHCTIDVRDLGCDFLACSPYKFFGPHLGVVWGRRDLLEAMHAYKCRCTPASLPGKFETGTVQLELLAGLTAAVDHMAWLGDAAGSTQPSESRRKRIEAGFAAAQAYETPLTRRLIDGLIAMDGIEIFGITNSNQLDHRVPTVSFRHRNVKPRAISEALAAEGVFIWDGHNYAYEVVRHLGIPEAEGVVRIGIAHYNTLAEVEATLSGIAAAIAGAEP